MEINTALCKTFLEDLSILIRLRPLSDLEISIIELLTQSKTYLEISIELNYREGYIGDIARELFGLISQQYHVKVTRANFLGSVQKLIDTKDEPDFRGCHGIKPEPLLSSDTINFNQYQILFSLSRYWKFDAINKSLVLKNKFPVVLPLSGLEPSQLGNTLISLSRQSQVNSEALLELVRILDIYFKS